MENFALEGSAFEGRKCAQNLIIPFCVQMYKKLKKLKTLNNIKMWKLIGDKNVNFSFFAGSSVCNLQLNVTRFRLGT